MSLSKREKFVSDSLYAIGAVNVGLCIAQDVYESAVGIAFGSAGDIYEGQFIVLCLASFFLFEGAYAIRKKTGFILSCSALIAVALGANDIYADLYLEYINPYLAPLATSPLYDRTEWLLGVVGGAFLLINIIAFYGLPGKKAWKS